MLARKSDAGQPSRAPGFCRLPALPEKPNDYRQMMIRPVIGRFTKMLDAQVRGIPFTLDLGYRAGLGVKV
jgi:hypothetical protein